MIAFFLVSKESVIERDCGARHAIDFAVRTDQGTSQIVIGSLTARRTSDTIVRALMELCCHGSHET